MFSGLAGRCGLACWVVAALVWTGCEADRPGVKYGVIEHDDVLRTYRVYVPPLLKKSDPVPLLVALHGSGGTSIQFAQEVRFDALADAEQFIVVYPDAVDYNWNDGRVDPAFPSGSVGLDDVGFVRSVVDQISLEYAVDTSRIYITGSSNGGMMALRMACEASDLFAAAAPVIATMPSDLTPMCKPENPMPIIFIHGMADPIIPWNGGFVFLFGVPRGWVDSVEETVSFWAAHNACKIIVPDTWLPDRDPTDRTHVWKREYLSGTDGAEVVLYGIMGGGHDWPSSYNSYLREAVTGNNSQDIDATTEVWAFLSRFRR